MSYLDINGLKHLVNKLNEMIKKTTSSSNEGVPVGSVFWIASTIAPTGYLICDGALIRRQDYTKLYSAIGTTFGVGDGSSTFALPDLRASFIRGAGQNDGYKATFGSIQQATSLREIKKSSSGNYVVVSLYANDSDKSEAYYTEVPSVASKVQVETGNYYTRPYNIALTPIIKY